MKTKLIKRGPWKGFHEIKMPKISWEESEAYVQQAWNHAVEMAIKFTRKFKRRSRIIQELKRELMK